VLPHCRRPGERVILSDVPRQAAHSGCGGGQSVHKDTAFHRAVPQAARQNIEKRSLTRPGGPHKPQEGCPLCRKATPDVA